MQRVYYFIWQSYTISLDVLCSWCVFLNLLVKMCLIFEVLACALVVVSVLCFLGVCCYIAWLFCGRCGVSSGEKNRCMM